jgi:hypothetical protein
MNGDTPTPFSRLSEKEKQDTLREGARQFSNDFSKVIEELANE